MKFTIDDKGDSQSVNLGLAVGCLLNQHADDDSNKAFSYYLNNNELARDYNLFFENYEFCSKVIFNILNSKEDIDVSYDYCRILTSPWALTFTMIALERYQSIIKLIGNNCIELENKIENANFILEKAGDLFRESQSDKYNNLIIFQILSAIQKFRGSNHSSTIKCLLEENDFVFEPSMIKPKRRDLNYRFTQKVIDFIKYKLTNFAEYAMSLKAQKSSRALFLLPEFSIFDIIRIFVKQKSAFQILHSVKIPAVNNLNNNREFSEYSRVSENNELSFVLQELILKNLPREFLECFNQYKNSAHKLIGNEVSSVITRSPTDTNPIVRHIMAQTYDLKILSISMQHGGGYNNYENHPLDLLERTLVDKYLVWGGISIKPSMVVGITRTSWFSLYPKKYYNNNGNLLIVAPPLRRYYAGDFSYPISFVFAYQQNMQIFFRFLKKTFYKKTVYRMGWDFGAGEAEWIKGISPQINISTRENVSHAYKDVLRSRIVVCTYNSTLWLELSKINHPFVLVLDGRYDLITSLNEKVFSIMEENNMLFFNPEAAAKHVSNCFENLSKWWEGEKVQLTRIKINDAFCQSLNPYEFAKNI